MEWEQLEYFQTLARMQHVTKAAKSLSITQPRFHALSPGWKIIWASRYLTGKDDPSA
ncbi:Transcriptional regulator [Bacillus subtilis J27]|nr:Transcriptional regulator [Bacillus subtilis J27]